MKVHIVSFSGTGSTTLVAQTLAQRLTLRGVVSDSQQLHQGVPDLVGLPELLFLLYPVHGCNAPRPVYDWIRRLPNGKRPDGNLTPVVVLSISGGGDVWPNKACRVRVVAKLKKKGYRTPYERMLAMPSNWIIATPTPLAVRMLDILPHRLDRIIEEVLSGMERHTDLGPIDRLTALLGELEKVGAREFGKRIIVKETCTQCGLCVQGCPAGNLTLIGGQLVIGSQCELCLNCLYHCPVQALIPGSAKFILVPEGYDLKPWQKLQPWTQPLDIEDLTKNWAWAGVRKYLLEEKDSII